MIVWGACVAFGCATAIAAVAGDADERPVRTTAGGRLIWDSADELDLLGDLWVDLPFYVSDRSVVFIALDTRTAISRTATDFTFLVRDLQYDFQLGWRDYPGWFGGWPVSLFLGQRGLEAVDADGQAYVRYAAFGLQSKAFRRFLPGSAPKGLLAASEWRFSLGPVLEEREVAADAMLRGRARFPLLRFARDRTFAVDLQLDGLVDGTRLRADTAAGFSLALPDRGGRRALFFAHYQHSRNPLGIGHSAVLLGFEYAEGEQSRTNELGAPNIDGLVALGAGEDSRLSGQLRLRVLSPQIAAKVYFIAVVDANVLTAEETGDLFYFYHLGFERPILPRFVAGAYFYHRSNHRLAEAGDGVTSINVLEAGIESRDWHRPGRRSSTGRWGQLDARARVGLLLDSSFGEETAWHLRAGVRWSSPVVASVLQWFLLADIETGDVERRLYAVGLSPTRSLDLQLEARYDEQYFSADDRLWLVNARYGF
jgi:hypothetical protein